MTIARCRDATIGRSAMWYCPIGPSVQIDSTTLLLVAVHRAKYLTFKETNNDDVVPSCVGVCVCVCLPVRWVPIGRAGSHSCVSVCVCV